MVQNPTETQLGAHQVIAEILADMGPAFVLDAVADACEQDAKATIGEQSDVLQSTANLMRQMVTLFMCL